MPAMFTRSRTKSKLPKVRRAKRRKTSIRSKRDRFAMGSSVGMTPQVATDKVISFEKYKALVRYQILRFSGSPGGGDSAESGYITPAEAARIVEANEARVREAYERGIPSRKVSKTLLP